ncbi:hypothetical protein [Haloarchaeobius baliensis]|uniref:hypothetical protein n=1 Tax=Haloarchaeobius baliensis TaxID=1670458 RepID=UPI003F8823C7
MDSEPSEQGLTGIIVYFLFLLGSVIIGPLEAVLGLALYWLFSSQDETATSQQG